MPASEANQGQRQLYRSNKALKPLLPRASFAHGDLSTENFFVNGIVDFDNCGWYPEGFDLALMLSQIKSFNSVNSLVEWATSRCNLDLQNYACRLSFLFFCFIFYSRRARGVMTSDDLLVGLWDDIFLAAKTFSIM